VLGCRARPHPLLKRSSAAGLRRRPGWRRVVVDVRLFGVLLVFFCSAVVVGVGQLIMIVLVGVPRRAMIPLAQRSSPMIVRDVVVIVSVRDGGMDVLGLFSFTLSSLDRLSFGRHC
jgi:hypothetical protein